MTLFDLDQDSLGAAIAFARPDVILAVHAREKLLERLSDDERARHARFRFENDRDIYLVAHVLVRRMLARVSGAASDSFVFEAGEHGRPEIASPEAARRFRFNLSHTHGLVACAVTRVADIGVDVEYVERKVEILSVGNHVFSAIEVEGLAALSGDAQRERFFDLWTLKEAYIKAIGKGLSAPLRAITFDPAKPDPVPVQFGPEVADRSERWCLRRIPVGPAHRLALALAAEPSATIRCQEASPHDLG
jgi:4'-phosphopantetheinyl transferase